MDANRKILVVDDQEDLRTQVARMLEARSANSETSSLLEQIRNRISKQTEAKPKTSAVTYQVDTVGQGQDAYEMVKNSFAEHQPYALMFLDMRMPPGWDGMETAQRIRGIDKEIQIVIMTAYADYDQKEISEKIGEPDKLLYIKKPFHPEEIRQLALAMTEKWNMNRREKERLILTNRLMRENSALTRQTFRDIKESYNSVLDGFVSFLDARAGVLVRRNQGRLETCAATHPDHGPLLLNRLTDEQKAARRTLTVEKDGIGLFPVSFDNFDGFIYTAGKSLIFSFEQLMPFIDILNETAREVLMNAFLKQQQDAHRQMSAVTLATGRIANKIDIATTRITEIADHLRTGQANGHTAELWGDLGRATSSLSTLSREIQELNAGLNLAAPRETVSLSTLLQVLLTSYSERLKAAKITLKQTIEPGLTLQGIDENLRRAIGHLVENAIEALDRSPADRVRQLEVSAQMNDGAPPMVNITIRDNGPGIDDAIADSLYAPFVTAGKADANGLGATIAKQVVEQHRGSITHASEPGKGAMFHVLLPVQAE